MLQRDFVMNEARKFALMLAKLLGLKAEGEYEEYLQNFNDILQDEYNTELAELVELDEDDFKRRLLREDQSSEKLNALAQLLYVFAEPFTNDEQTASLLKKVMLIFDVLETKHHYDSFENISRRKAVYDFFNNYYERT
jgi:hypothetical protein